MSAIANYIQLTKPSIILLVLVTAFAALAAQGILFEAPVESMFMVVAIGMAAGSANAFNQFLDRDIDSVMQRTKKRRPIPMGKIKPLAAFVFAAILGVASTFYLWWAWSFLAAFVSAATIFFYTVIYTLWLKRRHHYNIVIGGAAGAAGPLIAWAAVEGHISLYAWILFLIIFMWTPPHFWALALAIKDEYGGVKVPMLPVSHGDRRTRIEVFWYTVSLLPLTILPFWLGYTTLVFLVGGLALWVLYLLKTIRCLKEKTKPAYMSLFFFSILYLFALFLIVSIDGAYQFYWKA